MLIVPKSLASRYALDTKGLEWQSKELSQICELSFTQRSKSMRARYWYNVWKRGKSTLPRSGLILKPCHVNSFLEKWTSSLVGIHAKDFQQQEKGSEQKTLDTYGPTSLGQLMLFAPASAFLRTWKDTSPSDYDKCLPTYLASDTEWQLSVENQRGAYSQRLKSAHRTNGNGCLSWPSPRAGNPGSRKPGTGGKVLQEEVRKNWPTPEAQNSTGYQNQKNGTRTERLGTRVLIGQQDQERSNTNGKNQGQSNWPTPNLRDTRRGCNQRQLATEVDKNWPTPKANEMPTGVNAQGGLSLTSKVGVTNRQSGKLNPSWVEQLMGLPVGWSQLSTATEPLDNRVDRLRLLGNGVVPQTAEKAFRTLLEGE